MTSAALVELLQAAAPGLPISPRNDPWHREHARAELPDAETVQFAYLFERGGQIRLALYPADTLGQARAFYKDDARVRSTLELARDGWDLEPNFHFGYMEKGLTWTTSRLEVRDYTDYWRGRIHTLNAFPRADWERELSRLVRDGVFNENDRAQFDVDFTETRRTEASPRPGLRVSRVWPLDTAGEPDFPERLRGALAAALAGFGEHRSLRALGL